MRIRYLGLSQFSGFITDATATIEMRQLFSLRVTLQPLVRVGFDPLDVFSSVEFSKIDYSLRAISLDVILNDRAPVTKFILPPAISLKLQRTIHIQKCLVRSISVRRKTTFAYSVEAVFTAQKALNWTELQLTETLIEQRISGLIDVVLVKNVNRMDFDSHACFTILKIDQSIYSLNIRVVSTR